MCTGVAIAFSEAPASFAETHIKRVHEREGTWELQFHWWESPTVLPVQYEGELRLLPWGSKHRRSRLPFGPWIAEHFIADGALAQFSPEPVVIPANLGFDRGTWFVIEQGIQGVVLPEVREGPIVYIVTRPSTNYYRNMAGKCDWQPALINQLI